MAIRTPPSWLQAGSHPAENDRLGAQSLWSVGGVRLATDCAVTASGGMTLSVSAGWVHIRGTVTSTQGVYTSYNDGPQTLNVAPSNPTLGRIDRVVITVNDSAYGSVADNVVIQILTGTPAASPVAPTTPANSISLATIVVGAAVTSINSGNITSTRTRAATLDWNIQSSGATAVPLTVLNNSGSTVASINNTGAASFAGDVTTPALTLSAGSRQTATITAVSWSGGSVTFTANNTFAAGNIVQIRMDYTDGGGSSPQTQPYNFERATVATATATQFTVVTADQGTVTAPPFAQGIATRIGANTLEVQNSSGSTVAAIDQFGVLTNQAFTLVSQGNYNTGTSSIASAATYTFGVRLNNILTTNKMFVSIRVSTLSGTSINMYLNAPTLNLTSNGTIRNSALYNYGTVSKTANATALTSGGAISQSSIPLPPIISANVNPGFTLSGFIYNSQESSSLRYTTMYFEMMNQYTPNKVSLNGNYTVGQTHDGLFLTLPVTNAGGSTASEGLNIQVATYSMR